MSKTKEIIALKQFYQIENSDARYILMRGSTRSGKTVSIIQWLLSQMMSNEKLEIVIGVETLSNAKGSVLKDLEEWIQHFGLYSDFVINKSEFTYKYKPTKSVIRVVPCDKDSKWFGLKADIFWFNEATHIDKSFFEQAQMRLPDRTDFKNRIIMDFNPTNPFSWVRELENSEVSGGVDVFVSTYIDNPFLGEKQKKTIEDFKLTNYNKWLVFAKGEYGEVRGAVYTNWEVCDVFPKDIDYWYGLDFGFTNDPTALIKVGLQNGEIYVDECIYDVGLTNPDICTLMSAQGITNDEIVSESSEPKSIEEIKRHGFNIRKTDRKDILLGIDVLQRYKINVTRRSKNVQDEIVNYVWMENKSTSTFINKPVDNWNHALDALRYVALSKLYKKKNSFIKIR